MSIQNRLKKMESHVVKKDYDFCGCYEKHWRSALDSAYNDNPSIEIKVYPEPSFETGFCNDCKKPFSSKDLDMSKNLAEIYGEQ